MSMRFILRPLDECSRYISIWCLKKRFKKCILLIEVKLRNKIITLFFAVNIIMYPFCFIINFPKLFLFGRLNIYTTSWGMNWENLCPPFRMLALSKIIQKDTKMITMLCLEILCYKQKEERKIIKINLILRQL